MGGVRERVTSKLRLDTAVRGDLCCFVLLAKSALENNQKDVAAVLASAALEDALKRYASLHGLDVAGKEMQDVINALKQTVWCQVPKKSPGEHAQGS